MDSELDAATKNVAMFSYLTVKTTKRYLTLTWPITIWPFKYDVRIVQASFRPRKLDQELGRAHDEDEPSEQVLFQVVQPETPGERDLLEQLQDAVRVAHVVQPEVVGRVHRRAHESVQDEEVERVKSQDARVKMC